MVGVSSSARSTSSDHLNRSSIRRSNGSFYMSSSFRSMQRAAVDGFPEPSSSPSTTIGGTIQTCCRHYCCGGCSLSSAARQRNAMIVDWINRLIRSSLWRIIMVVLAVFLLFGSPIQHLWAPTEDLVFDILATITLGFFLVDMVMRTVADPRYFRCHLKRTRNLPGLSDNRDNTSTPRIAIGSFIFWCDLISTVALLYDISYINPSHHEVTNIVIRLDSTGLPMSGYDTSNRLRPVGLELVLLVTIARCARVARFVQSRIVADTSNRINWYFICKMLQRFNPWFLCEWCRKRKSRKSSVVSIAEEESVFSAHHNGKNTNRWGAVHVGVLAAVRAQAEAEAREAQAVKANGWKVVHFMRRSVSFLGGRDRKELLRDRYEHEAAIKIQRCWKAHLQQVATASNEGGSLVDQASNDEDMAVASSKRSHSVTQLGRTPKARSALRLFGQRNARAGGKLSAEDIKMSDPLNDSTQESRFQSDTRKGRESQVGSDMRALTGQRVALGVLLALVFTVVFTYTEATSSSATAMVVLHEQTKNEAFRDCALDAARSTSVPGLYSYSPVNGSDIVLEDATPRERDQLKVTVVDSNAQESSGYFSLQNERNLENVTELVATIFIILIWFAGTTAFSGPVMNLVVVPIERMVQLLGMLMLDPLGYQSTARFKQFLLDEDNLVENTKWTKEVLKGMETSFLMSTILRIGSLMQVGFGSAGVEIIRNNLQMGQSKNMLVLNSQGSTVSCIFLFCDIRQFTDATECLQEEVFVFTNRIAAVVHSFCHSYGGAANKNVGDAFLLSWSLEDGNEHLRGPASKTSRGSDAPLQAKNNQADKALLSVIKIMIALFYDKFYMEPLSDMAKQRLKGKLRNRAGPVVQMGFGLHAGKAVQGAIGSQRKIDATYVSEAVERAEFLESSTKKYGLKMLMSDSFHRLLHQNTRRRCRKVDQILIMDEEEDEDEDDDQPHGERMDLYTFDIEVGDIHRPQRKLVRGETDTNSDAGSVNGEWTMRGRRGDRRQNHSTRQIRRRRSMTMRSNPHASEEINPSGGTTQGDLKPNIKSSASVGSVQSVDDADDGPPELVLPTETAIYNHSLWQSQDMKQIRESYVQGMFFQKYNSGLQSFYRKDWDSARQCFQTVLDNFDDGPSKYFMAQMDAHDNVPPKRFLEYGLA